MTKKLIAVNLALLIVGALLGWRLYVSVAGFDAEHDLSKLQPAKEIKQSIVTGGGLPAMKPRRQYNPEEFSIIPAQNLFAESRSSQTETEAPPVDTTPRMIAKPVLVGVTIAGDKRLASVVDPAGAAQNPGAARRAQTKRVGDVFQGFTIVDITDSQMVLAAGSQREIIPLFDSTKQRTPGGKTPIVATRIVNFGGGGSPAARPAVVQTTATPTVVTPPTPSVGPAVAAIGGTAQPAPGSAQPGAASRAAAAQTLRQTPGVTQAQPPAWNERTDEQGRRIIRTPFGDIIRERPPDN